MDDKGMINVKLNVPRFEMKADDRELVKFIRKVDKIVKKASNTRGWQA